jgi:hypothetical protein
MLVHQEVQTFIGGIESPENDGKLLAFETGTELVLTGRDLW